MDDREYVLDAMRKTGLSAAADFQVRSVDMTGTEMYQEEDFIPDFQAAKAAKNMLERKAGQEDGFVCKSTAGRVVRLIQNYDSEVYTQEPEDLPAQWRFVWSTDPEKALPFISISTSPYATGDCCTFGGHVWRSGQDGNVWEPGTINVKWDDLGTIEDVMAGNITEPEPDPGEEPEPEPTDYPEWKQPTGEHDAYNTGDIVRYNGALYRSLIYGNV